MGTTTALRREIKRVFVPLATARGFDVDMREAPAFLAFRRTVGDTVQLFDLQWDKHGDTRFVVNLGTCPRDGLVLPDRVLPVEAVIASWTADAARLQPRRGATTASWFRQDKPLPARLLAREKFHDASAVVSQLVSLFPEAEAYLADGRVGPHVHVIAR